MGSGACIEEPMAATEDLCEEAGGSAIDLTRSMSVTQWQASTSGCAEARASPEIPDRAMEHECRQAARHVPDAACTGYCWLPLFMWYSENDAWEQGISWIKPYLCTACPNSSSWSLLLWQ